MKNRTSRSSSQTRTIKFTKNYTSKAHGSVLAECGSTKILCTASIINSVPRFLRDAHPKQGWLTAEYSMLPGATYPRNDREVNKGKVSGRTAEIQRLIGRSLRSCLDLKKIPDYTIAIDCDVIEADGGTRTTAINGAYVAMVLAIQKLQYKKSLQTDPLIAQVAAISTGINKDKILVDLDYNEDSSADVDMNIVMNQEQQIIEIQGTAEKKPIAQKQLFDMLQAAETVIKNIIQLQNDTINVPIPVDSV